MKSYEEFLVLCKKMASIDPSLVSNETGTREYLVYSLLDFIGFNIKSQNLKPEEDAGIGRADAVLYAKGKPAIVVEIKKASIVLSDVHQRQLIGYMKCSKVKFPVGILTNGYEYRFFFDKNCKGEIELDEPPFFVFSVRNPTRMSYEFLKALEADSFSKESVRTFYEGCVSLRKAGEKFKRDSLFSVVSENWENASGSRILTTPVEHRVFGCLVGMVSSLGTDPDLVTCKDNSTYFAVNFAGEPLCKVYQDDKDSDATDGSGRIEFFERDCETGERARDYRNLPAKMLKPLKFSSVYDVCRGEIRKTVIDHIDLIRRMRGL